MRSSVDSAGLGKPLRFAAARYVAWITALTVASATLFASRASTDLVRPLFFTALLIFFVVLGRREPPLRSLAYRLIEIGFLVLSTGSVGAAILRHRSIGFVWLADSLDGGVFFLLGFCLLSYGIVLWVPELVESRRILEQRVAEQRVALDDAGDLITRQNALVSVGELATGVAHELRNPLAVVSSGVQRLRSESLGEGELERCVEVIERAVDKANKRIRGLLDLGRDSDFLPRIDRVAELLEEAVELARASAHSVGVEIEDPICCQGALYHGDRELLCQVLLNLLQNAIQAEPHAGPIRVGHEELEGGACRIWVEDRGRGLSEEQRERLFEPFFSSKLDGTGLGLNISAGLVEKHRGRLWLEGGEVGGTRAYIELPAVGPRAVNEVSSSLQRSPALSASGDSRPRRHWARTADGEAVAQADRGGSP